MFHSNKRLQGNTILHKNLRNTQRIDSIDSGLKIYKTTCHESFRQYLKNTTLHGLNIFFGFMFSVVISLSAYFIANVYNKYSSSPMIISLSSVSTDITELPFPAVTVCNMNQAIKSVVANYEVDSEELSMIQSICTIAVDKNVKNSKTGKWADFQKILVDVSQSCKDMLISCKYGGFEYNCTDVFVTVLTDEGFCCTFNAVNRKFTAKSNIKSEK